MGNGALGSLVNLEGDDFEDEWLKAMCKAWYKEAKPWCEELLDQKKKLKEWKKNGKVDPQPKLPRRSFNDRFFKELSIIAPDVRAGIQREFPLGLAGPAGYFSMTGLANSPDPAMHEEAQQMLDFYKTNAAEIEGDEGFHYDDLRGAMVAKSNDLFGSYGDTTRAWAGSTFYVDGLKDGVAIEIKGPEDTEHGDKQFEKYQRTSPKKKILIVDNQACDPSGDITNPDGSCKEAPSSASV
jgi:hypothetical protein